MKPTEADWERYISRLIERGHRQRVREQDWYAGWFNRFPGEEWRGFCKTGVEGIVYEDAFRDHFVEKMIKPNFTHWRCESQLFDVVAYRTHGDAKCDTPWYLWEARNDEHYAGSIRHHLDRIHRDVLDPPPFFPGGGHLYGFELKTDSDEVYHFLDQLPRYASIFDKVVLVIGESQKPPKRLPGWVEVLQRRGDDYVRVKSAQGTYTFLGVHAFDPAKWYMPHNNSRYEDFDYSGATAFSEFVGFLKRCAIAALFKSEAVEPYTDIDRAIYDSIRDRRVKKRVEPIQLVSPDNEPVVKVPRIVEPVKRLEDFIEVPSCLASNREVEK